MWALWKLAPADAPQHADVVTLRWEAPPQCPAAADVQREIDARSRGQARPVTATGSVRAKPRGGYVLEIAIEGLGGSDRRTIESDACASLAEIAGLLIAVAADPTTQDSSVASGPRVIAEPPGASISPESSPETRPRPEVESETPVPAGRDPANANGSRPSAKESRIPIGGALRIDALGQFLAVLPRTAGFGIGVAGAIRLPSARAELRARYLLPQPRDYSDHVGVGGSFDLWVVGAVACWEPSVGRTIVTLPICGGAELGAMRGRSRGVDETGLAHGLFAAAVVDGAVVVTPFERLGLRLGVEGVVALTHPSFHVRGLPTLFRSGRGGLRVAAGVEVRFP